ncbi:hypothetical protein QQG55_15020 [Brugia pahangi]
MKRSSSIGFTNYYVTQHLHKIEINPQQKANKCHKLNIAKRKREEYGQKDKQINVIIAPRADSLQVSDYMVLPKIAKTS